MIKVVVFDYGGTLANSDPSSWDSVSRDISELLLSRGIEINPNDLQRAIFETIEWRREVHKSGREINSYEFFNHALGTLGYAATLDETDEMEMFMYRGGETEWLGGLHTLLPALADDYRLALLSNAWLEGPRHMLRELDHSRWFDVMVCSFDIGIPKPDPRIFHHLLRLLKVEPHEAVMVGDSIKADMDGAINVGMKAILVDVDGTSGWNGTTIHSVDELPEVLVSL